VPVWQLVWESEAIGGRLTTLRVWFEGFAGLDPLGPRLRLGLHVDADGDGAVDADSAPLVVSQPAALGFGSALLVPIDLALPPAATGQLLLTAWLDGEEEDGCSAAAVGDTPPLLAAALLLLWGGLRGRRRRQSGAARALATALLVAGLALAGLAVSACLRGGFGELRQGRFEIRAADDLTIEASVGHRLWVQQLPVQSGVIQVLR
jgi:uncharacterized protein (TIGR03382 family)